MGISELTKRFDNLPELAKREVEDFIEFLEKKYARKKGRKRKTRKSNFGSAKGQIKISGDFDDPLEDFKDYM